MPGLGELSGEEVREETWGIWISCLIWMLLVPFQPLLVEVVMALFWPYMPGMGETMEGWLDIWRWVRRTWSAGL